jgi:protein SCO1/2
MSKQADKSNGGWLVWGLLGLVIVAIAVAFVREERRRAAYPPLPVISTLTDFNLTNQLGAAVSLDDLKGRVWVADVIFTRCPGPCLTLSKKFAELQERLPDDEKVKLVSLTVDPDFDTPEVLERYGKKLGTDPDKWWFLTGDKAELRRLAIRDFQFVVVDKDAEEMENEDDLFIHSTYFMVVDKRGRVRKNIESMEPEGADGETPSAVDQALQAVEQLLNER